MDKAIVYIRTNLSNLLDEEEAKQAIELTK